MVSPDFGRRIRTVRIRRHMLSFVAAFVALNVWWAFTGTGGAVAFAAHLGGFATGAAVVVIAGASGTARCCGSGLCNSQ